MLCCATILQTVEENLSFLCALSMSNVHGFPVFFAVEEAPKEQTQVAEMVFVFIVVIEDLGEELVMHGILRPIPVEKLFELIGAYPTFKASIFVEMGDSLTVFFQDAAAKGLTQVFCRRLQEREESTLVQEFTAVIIVVLSLRVRVVLSLLLLRLG